MQEKTVEEALRDILDICKHRWRALPKDSPEKKSIHAAEMALERAAGDDDLNHAKQGA